LFDCDGTLYIAQFGRGLMKYAEVHNRSNLAKRYRSSLVLSFVLNKLKLMQDEMLQRLILERMGWMIKGWTIEEGSAAFQWLALEYLLSTQRADVVARLRQHQAAGDKVVLVSASFTPCLEIIGKELGADGIIGTQLEIKDGLYTGNIIPPVIKGVDKVKFARAFFTSQNMDVDWSASHAYGDSLSDQDMLTLVGHPIVVYPARKLYELAQQQRWEVIGTPQDY